MRIINQPNNITDQDINSWINNFDLYVHTLLQDDYDQSFREIVSNTNVFTLEFSDELIVENGGVSLQSAKKLIFDNWSFTDKELVNRISRARTIDELSALVPWIADSGSLRNGEHNYNKSKDELNSILGGNIHLRNPGRIYVLGQYFDYCKKIVLYKEAIKKCCNNQFGIKSMYDATFAHELFHAYHYFHSCGHEIERRTDYTSKVVKESLAAFFEYYYCKQKSIPTDIDIDWQDNPVSVYPYSGAKYLMPYNHDISEGSPLFTKVLNESRNNFDNALRTLFSTNEDDFYAVKNHKELNTAPITIQPNGGYILNSPMNDYDLFVWLNKMGVGWFILKYADDHFIEPSPIPLRFGSPNSVATRESVYRTTVQYHEDMIRLLKKKRLYFRIRVGKAPYVVNSRELQRILDLIP